MESYTDLERLIVLILSYQGDEPIRELWQELANGDYEVCDKTIKAWLAKQDK